MGKLIKASWRRSSVVVNTGIKFVQRPVTLALALTCLSAVGLFAVVTSSSAVGTFAPTIAFELSTNRATAHPDARITIDNSNSSEDIEGMTIKLPNGFWGSLAAADKCTYSDAQANLCTSASQVGTVDSTGIVDKSDARLRGKVYLTDPAPANVSTDPAGITVIVPAKVGGVDLGNVVVNARVGLRNATLPALPTPATGAIGAVEGVNTIVNNIPKSITDSHGRTVNFHLNKMTIDLISKLLGPKPPLLTNPSTCSTITTSATITSYASQTVPVSDPFPDTITGCNTVKFAPDVFDVAATVSSAGADTGLTTEIRSPADSASFKSVVVKMPPMIGPNSPAFGVAADQCPAATSIAQFNPAACPVQAKVGTVTIETPLLPSPLVGDVYLINKSPVPNLGLNFDSTTNPVSPGNPNGVTIRLVGISSLLQVDPSCDPIEVGECQKHITAQFTNLPDAPTTKITLSMNGADRTGQSATLSGKILAVSAPNDSSCQPKDEFTGSFVSNSGATVRADRVKTQSFSGCNQRQATIDDSGSSPIGKVVTDSSPSIAFSNPVGGGSGTFRCAIDLQYLDLGNPAIPGDLCTSPFSPSTPLTAGVHRFFAVKDGLTETRAFATEPAAGSPNVAPDTNFTSTPPSTTADTTPTFDFGADEPSKFQCAIGPGSDATKIGAFLPCGSATDATVGSFTVAAGDSLIAGMTYTFAVRAQDPAGLVDLYPASKTFSVDVPFAPTIDYFSTTAVARAHPDLDITIDNPSHEDIKDVTVKLPDGFFGGLQGVQVICSVALADAGNCPVGSRVGTVQTEGIVDESVIRIDGEVFLTDAREPGDAASISIKVPAVIQDINMGNIIVSARLAVRDGAKGIDTMVVSVPNHITPDSTIDPWDSTTYFDLRKMTMKMRTGPGAAQPLLTNPSSCDPHKFEASFAGYISGSSNSSTPYPVSDCDALGFAPTFAAEVHKPGTVDTPPDSTNLKVIDMSAKVTANPDQAGIKEASILLPKPLTMEVANLSAVCEHAQYELDACPENTRIGIATATSPLLAATDPPLSGPVYMLRGNGTALPRLYVRLDGRISVGFVGTTSFENGTQIRTKFKDLPDAPLSSFTMTINGLLKTMKTPCELGDQYGYSITGDLTGHNGKTSAVDLPLKFDCSGVSYKFTLKRSGKRTKLNLSIKAQGSKQPKLRSAKMQLPKHLTLIKKGLKRSLVIKADGKRLKPKCFKYLKPNLLKIGLCGRPATRIDLSFKPGSLSAGKKLRRGSATVTTVDINNETRKHKLNLFSRGFGEFAMP